MAPLCHSFGDTKILQGIQNGSDKQRTAKLYLPLPGRSVAGRTKMQNCCQRATCFSIPQTPHCNLTTYLCVHFCSHNKHNFLFYRAGNSEFSRFCRCVAQISVSVPRDAAPLETKLCLGALETYYQSRDVTCHRNGIFF